MNIVAKAISPYSLGDKSLASRIDTINCTPCEPPFSIIFQKKLELSFLDKFISSIKLPLYTKNLTKTK